eukprot:5584241-Heterocapsa_arctica.AAC.1
MEGTKQDARGVWEGTRGWARWGANANLELPSTFRALTRAATPRRVASSGARAPGRTNGLSQNGRGHNDLHKKPQT